MLGSIISYIALRLLGEGPEDGEDRAMARGRGWILDRGGAVAWFEVSAETETTRPSTVTKRYRDT